MKTRSGFLRAVLALAVVALAVGIAATLLWSRPTPSGGTQCDDRVLVIATTPGYQDGESGNYVNDGRGESCADLARPRGMVALGLLVVGGLATALTYRLRPPESPPS